MQIAVVGGTGREGRGLALRWARKGHRVTIGSRDAARAAERAAELSTPDVKLEGGDNAWAVARADVAVGTLALYRKQMQEACALKVRRYLAYGLPVILGHVDTDFIGRDEWYILSLPNTATNVADGLDSIRKFVADVKGRRVPRGEVEPILSVSAKERERLSFFRELTL